MGGEELLLAGDAAQYGTPISYDVAWTGYVPHAERRHNDAIFTVLFVICIVLSISLGIWGGQKYGWHDPSATTNWENSTTTAAASPIVLPALGGLVASVIFSALWYKMLQACTIFMVYASIVLYLLLMVVAAVGMIIGGAVSGQVALIIVGVIFLIFPLIFACVLFANRNRIEFTANLIASTITCMQQHPSTMLVVAPIVYLGTSLLGCTMGVAALWTASPSVPPIVLLAAILHLFAAYWVVEQGAALGQHSYAGVFAQWYFSARTAFARVSPLGVLWTGLSKSFGSLAFGSCLLAIIRTGKALLRIAESRAREGGGGGAVQLVALFVFCCLRCLCSLLEAFVRYITRYANIYVAMRGQSFCQAGRSTFNLFGRTLFQPLLNDNITGMVVGIGSLTVILLSVGAAAGVGAVVTHVGGYSYVSCVPGIILAALIAVAVMYIVGLSVVVGVDTLFVCLAEDAEACAQSGAAIACPAFYGVVVGSPDCPPGVKACHV